MKKGGFMIYLFLLGVACFIGAVWIYSRAEDNSLDKFVSLTQETKGDVARANEKCEELRTSFKEMIAKTEELRKSIIDGNTEWAGNVEAAIKAQSQDLKKLTDEVEILKIRQHSMDKKIIGKEQTFNIKTDQPIAVEFRNAPPPAPKGKGKASLLKRSGVEQ